MNIDDKLFKVKYVSDDTSHLENNPEDCKNCKTRACTIICPANVWQYNPEEKKMVINYENCLECGACRIACEKQSLKWRYPKGTKGVTYKNS